MASPLRRVVLVWLSVALLLGLSLCPGQAAAEGEWEHHNLNNLTFARSLALDGAGRAHVGYTGWHNVHYAWDDGYAWHDEIIAEHSLFDFDSVAIALDGAGAPHVAYSQHYPSVSRPDVHGTPRGAIMWQTRGSSGWVGDSVTGADNMGYTVYATAVSTATVRHILYEQGGYPSALWYGRGAPGESWALEQVAIPITGAWGVGAGDLALDLAGRPVIAYRNYDAVGEPYLAVDRREISGTWTSLLREEGVTALDTSLAIAPDGVIHLLYETSINTVDGPLHTIQYTWQVGDAWWTTGAHVDAQSPDLALDATGAPHAAWILGSGGLGAMAYARRVGDVWQVETVVNANAAYPNLALDAANQPHLLHGSGPEILIYSRRPAPPPPPRFDPPTPWLRGLGVAAGGWTSQNLYPRLLGDVDGDGDADVVAFGNKVVYVALSDRTYLYPPVPWLNYYGPASGGWSSFDLYPRWVGDVDGDGMADIVAFGQRSVYVSLSTGTGFSTPTVWINAYGPISGGWESYDRQPRVLGDVNGDGMADIVAFGVFGVSVSLSTGSGFAPPQSWIAAYGVFAGGWTSQNAFPRWVADVDGDGLDDIVGFGNKAVYVSRSTGTTFEPPVAWIRLYGPAAGGWTSFNLYPRWLADVNGDGMADIVAFGNKAVYVSVSNGAGFDPPVVALNGYGPGAGGWTSYDLYPRLLGDLDRSGKADIVGFGNRATYASPSLP